MFIINIFFSIFLINSKNIILPIKRISFEKFIGKKAIDDYINYSIYTDIYVGTPPQKVTHFIEPNDSVFQFKKLSLQYNINKFNNSVNIIEDEEFSLFYSEKSSTYVGYYSDNFIFNTRHNTDKTIEVKDLQFTIYLNNRMETLKYGIIGLFTMISPSSIFKELYSFINQLKTKEIIDDYVFSFIYNNNDNYFGDTNELGEILIGEYSHIYDEKTCAKNEEVKIYSASSSHWSLMFDEIKFNYSNEEYFENHIETNYDFFSKFIKGTNKYKEKIEKLFFEELMNDNLCRKELISENKYTNKYDIYSCNNTNFLKDKIKNFPSLNFTIKSENLIFCFTYNDLFKIFDDRFYFMIIFPNGRDQSSQWSIGEIFISKFTSTFNIEAKSISFYKNQINKANNFIDNNNEKKGSSTVMRSLIEIFMGIIIIICIYFIYRKYRKTRKLLANELEDSNYAYVPNENKKETKLMNEKELNKV